MQPSIPRRSALPRAFRRTRAFLSERCTLARLADGLERVMPDLAQLGVGMLAVAAAAAFGAIDLRIDDAAAAILLAQAQDAATAGMPADAP